ncbi:hypothetical protein [Sphingobium indicum]|nr:hypothetical protein [Sphingobium indicum]
MRKSAVFSVGILSLGAIGGLIIFYETGSSTSKQEAVSVNDGGEGQVATQRADTSNAGLHPASMVGSWVVKDEFCASGAPLIFGSDGKYTTEGATGAWSFGGNLLKIKEDGAKGTEIGKVEFISPKEFSVRWEDNRKESYRLCTSNGQEPWHPNVNLSGDTKPAPQLKLSPLSENDLADIVERGFSGKFQCHIKQSGKIIVGLADDMAWVRMSDQLNAFTHVEGHAIGPRYYRMSVGTGMPGVGLSVSPTDSWRDLGTYSVAPVEVRYNALGDDDGAGSALTGTIQCDNKVFLTES